MVKSTSRFVPVPSAIKLAIDRMRDKDLVFLWYSAARVIVEGAEDVYEFYPEEATGIITEAHRIMRTEAAREFHKPDARAVDWIASLVARMRAGESPHKENAASRLFQNRALVREYRLADGNETVLEAAELAHAEATKECYRRGLPVPSWASLDDLPRACGSLNS